MTDFAIRPALTPDKPLPPAGKPTMYFVGVTTQQSLIMKVFPRRAVRRNGRIVIEETRRD